MDRSRNQALSIVCFIALTGTIFLPESAGAQVEYDSVVDVTEMAGPEACAAMQAALNAGLTGYGTAARRVLIRGQLGSAEEPVDFSMFHNPGSEGASGKAWPYSVCHAFWPIVNTKEGEGVVGGYPDPFFPGVLASSKAARVSGREKVGFQDPICAGFVFGRIRAQIASGVGKGQMRPILSCDSKTLATIEGEWDTPPDSTSVIRLIDWRNPRMHELDLRVHYDLKVFYQNSTAQAAGEYGVFADVGLHCYFTGAPRQGELHRGCLSRALDGIHRSGRITIREFGKRDDGLECRPTWPVQSRLMNRDYSIIWQALGPAVARGSDDTELYIVGDGDRDNVGVLLFNTWTKDFRRWRIHGIGTGLWIAGSLNNTLYDPYISQNEFGVVVGSNEDWGTGWPRWNSCFTGNCEPESYESTAMNFRGGVIEGNRCGNFVMFGGYGGEVDRTFIETGYKDSPLYAGHSVIVGAGVCDADESASPRQRVKRSGRACGDDQDCGGECLVNGKSRRAYRFAWDASLAGNRGDPRWFAFMLGKGTQARYLTWGAGAQPFIRVEGGGLGGEYGHGGRPLYFYASEGAAQRVDASGAQWAGSGTVLPAYEHFVGMSFKDLELVLEDPSPGYHFLGRVLSRSTCTHVTMSLLASASVKGRWTVRHGSNRGRLDKELIEGGRAFPSRGRPATIGAAEFDQPYVAAQSEIWLEMDSVSAMPAALSLTLRCWSDG